LNALVQAIEVYQHSLVVINDISCFRQLQHDRQSLKSRHFPFQTVAELEEQFARYRSTLQSQENFRTITISPAFEMQMKRQLARLPKLNKLIHAHPHTWTTNGLLEASGGLLDRIGFTQHDPEKDSKQ
jgi:hypothetical protein